MIQLGIRQNKQQNKRHTAGFTLVEVIVTMAVMAILLSILGVSVLSWVKHSKFNECNEYARSIYTAATMKLSYLDLNDELEDTMDEIVQAVGGSGGVNNLKNILGDGYFPSDVHAENLYYLYAKKGDYDIYLGDRNYGGRATGQNLLFSLIDEYSYDKSVLNANIVLEINVDTCEVYAVFVSNYASELTYGSVGISDEHGIVSLNAAGDYSGSRSEDTRYQLVLGYFCGKEGISAHFKNQQLSVTTNELFNDETLHLRFSSNSTEDMNRDVKFHITIRQPSTDPSKEDRKLFSLSLSMLELELNTDPDRKYDANAGGTKLVPVKVTFFDDAGNEFGIPETYLFPFSADSLGVMDLTLDAPVTAKVDTMVREAGLDQKICSTSIVRLLNHATIKQHLEKTSPDLYAEIFAQALTQQEAEAMGLLPTNPAHQALYTAILDNNYVSTAATVSNTENALYARDNRKSDDLTTDPDDKYDEITLCNARHLANIRYYDEKSVTSPFKDNYLGRAEFTMIQDIDFAKAVLYQYDSASDKLVAEADLIKQFPTIPKLYERWTLSGKKNALLQDSYTLNNFLIGNQSVYEPDISLDVNGNKVLTGNDAKAVGIVGVNEGTIENVNIGGSTLLANAARSTQLVSGGALGGGSIEQYFYSVKRELTALEGAGMLCGVNSEKGSIDAIRTEDDCVAYVFMNEGSGAADPVDLARGAGMVIGIQKGKTISRVKAGGLLRAQIYPDVATIATADGRKWDELFLGEHAPDEDLETARTAQINLEQKAIGIGGIAGVTIVRNKPDATSLAAAAYGEVKRNTVFSSLVAAFLEAIGYEQEKPVVNAVNVCGNQYTGGVTGNLYVLPGSGITQDTPVISNVLNKGIITASTYATADTNSTKGLFIGGIAGYANCGLIRDCVAKPGMDAAAAADYQDKTTVILSGDEQTTVAHQRLMQDTRGTFVGGIVGFAADVLIRGCETRSDSYVLGYDNVGGIAGMVKPAAASGSGIQLEISQKGSDELINKCYVIGHDNVGGIVGENSSGSKLAYCTNRGVVAGYGKNIGGITGRNLGREGLPAVIDNCGSFVYDYSGGIQELVWDTWKIFGNNAGGIAGYNEYSEINCSDTGESSNYTVSALVLGKNNVGGVVGLNGEHGRLATELQVEGGQVLAVGDAVGGYIGLNLSMGIFEQPIQIKPYRVVGARAVGGVIGVNLPIVGDAQKLTIIATNENTQGSVEGEQLVGGIIGVHRTLKSIGETENQTMLFEKELATASAIKLLFDETQASYTDRAVYTNEEGEKLQYVDTAVDESFETVIGQDDKTLVNNADIYVGGIGGGVLGYSALVSKTIVKNYDNTGAIAQSENEEARVSLVDYAAFTDERLKEKLKDQKSALAAGIIGYANKNLTVIGCENHGDILTENGSGGIVAINHGRIEDCANYTNMGMANSSVIGGVAAVNSGVITATQMGAANVRYSLSGDSYVGGIAGVNVGAGIIDGSTVNYADIGASVAGSNVGGIAGYNDATIVIKDTVGVRINGDNQSISGGDTVGGIIGTNAGTLNLYQLSEASGNTVTSDLIVEGERYIGGWIGRQESWLLANQLCNRAEVIAQTGYAGGIAGIIAGNGIDSAQNVGSVHAYGKTDGFAGGITAFVATSAAISNCKNKASVTSELSYAGGVAAVNAGTISGSRICTTDSGSDVTISGSSKEMGVFVARNEKTGRINNSIIDAGSNKKKIKLKADSEVIGLFAGVNYGVIEDGLKTVTESAIHAAVYGTIDISGSASGYDAVGGITGVNYGSIRNLLVYQSDFKDIKDYRSLGGIAGKNYARIEHTGYSYGKMSDQTASDAGTCYGGIVGRNESDRSLVSEDAVVSDSVIKSVTIDITGAYHANSSQSAEQKEALSVMVGGIAGINKDVNADDQTHATIAGCSIDTEDGYDKNHIIVSNGIVGGIVGFNQAVIKDSGYAKGTDTTALLMEKVRKAQDEYAAPDISHTDVATQKKRVGYEQLKTELKGVINARNTDPVKWVDKTNILEQVYYNGKSDRDTGKSVKDGKELLLELSTMGCIGGITGYNTGHGSVDYCMTGEWMIYNSSDSSEASTGGVIGMNESDADLGFLVNRAFVGRESKKNQMSAPKNDTDGNAGYFVGGIVGEQRNATGMNWSIYGGINIGTVYNRGSNYAAGILGRWTDNGGILEYCHNYGAIQNTFTAGGYGGSASGIVAELYHPVDYHSYCVLSCRNDGNIYVGMPHFGTGNSNFANSGSNENAGIMGNVVCNSVGRDSGRKEGQHIEINIVDCVNGPDTTIQAGSMAIGMLAYIGSDYVKQKGESDVNVIDFSAENVVVHIDRCRNYSVLQGRWHVAGMFGDRYSGVDNTYITDCYTVDNKSNAPGNRTYITYSGQGKNPAWTQGVIGNNSYNNFYNVFDDNAFRAYVVNKTDSDKLPREPYAYQINGRGAMLYVHFPQGYTYDETHMVSFHVSRENNNYSYQYRTEYLPVGGRAYLLAEAKSTSQGSITIGGIPKNTNISAIRVEIAARDKIQAYNIFESRNDNERNDYTKYGKYANQKDPNKPLLISGLKLGGNTISVSESTTVDNSRSRIDYGNFKKVANSRDIVSVKLGDDTYLVSLMPEFSNGKNFNLTAGTHRFFLESEKLMMVDTNQNADSGKITYACQIGDIIAKIDENIWKTIQNKDLSAKNQIESLMEDYYQKGVDRNTYPSTPENVSIEIVANDSGKGDKKPNKQVGKLRVFWDHPDMSVKYYLVDIYTEDGEKIYSDMKAFSNEVLVDLDKRMAGHNLVASVRAVNSNEVGMSDETASSSLMIGDMAPAPEFRIELVRDKEGKYTYRYALSDKSYEEINSKVEDWKVQFYFQGDNQVSVLTASTPAVYIMPTENAKDSNTIKRLYAQTISQSGKCLPSEQSSTQIDVRALKYIKPNLSNRNLTVNVTGSSIADAKIEVKIGALPDAEKGGLFPVYRVEIIDPEWKDSKGNTRDFVYAFRDVTIPNDGYKVVFDNLSEEVWREIGVKHNFKVHVWLAQTSLGPVYTWHDASGDNETDSKSGYEYQSRPDGIKHRIYSAILSDKQENIKRGQILCLENLNYELAAAPQISDPEWKINDADELEYTFAWKPGMTDPAKKVGYEMTLIGIKGSGDDQIRTVITKQNTNATSCIMNADNWSYDQVEVSVVERSSDSSVIGNIAKETFAVKSRMPKISQVTARLKSRNDQKYRISWRPLDEKYRSHDDFAGYTIFVNGKEEMNISNPDAASCEIDLEKVDGVDCNADGQTVSFEVVANSVNKPKKYVRSKKSIKRTITISKRMKLPVISGDYSFRTDAIQDAPVSEVTEAEFTSGLYLVVPMKEQINGSYLLNGFVYASNAGALSGEPKTLYDAIETAFNEKHGLSSDAIPLADGAKPVVMTFDKLTGEGANRQYNYIAKLPFTDVAMAAGYLQPVVRGASNTQISSYWTWKQDGGAQYVKLPKVKLNAPKLTDSYEKIIRTGEDNYWSAEKSFASKVPFNDTEIVQDVVLFDRSDYASSYKVELDLTGTGSTTETLLLDESGVTYGGAKYAFVNDECDFDDSINQTLEGTFRSGGRIQYYRILCGLRVQKTPTGYALILPQSSQVIGMDNRSVRVNNATKAVSRLKVTAVAADTSKFVDSNSAEK